MKFTELRGEILMQVQALAAHRKCSLYDAYSLLRSTFATQQDWIEYCHK